MIQITQCKSFHDELSMVYLFSKKDVKNKLSFGPFSEIEIEKISLSKEKFDFIKRGEFYAFAIFSEQSDEQLRVAGSKIQQQIGQKLGKIQISGIEKSVLKFAEGLILANYKFTKYFSKEEESKNKLSEIILSNEISNSKITELWNTCKVVYWTRDLVNEPVSYLTALKLAEEISTAGEEAGFSVNVLHKAQIEALKMGGLLGVNRGSMDPPTFTIAEYKHPKAVNKKPIVLVGKGVVYDTGGLSLKPTPGSMDCMKSDMAGAAAMAGTIYLAALQNLKIHLVVLIPATDNRPGMDAYTPGDILTMHNGTTVEVLNTDAEGRLILADALAYSDKYKPEVVIDAATLTGAAVRAIGTHASIVMGNADDKYFKELEEAGNEVHERVVRFPFWDEYLNEMKSSIADLKNIGGGNAGMITAGKFLEHFVKSPYIHMDVAGPTWLDAKEDYRTKGGTGSGVRLLYQFLKNRTN
ncbi:MAG: leucyl aminopeptidase family protein [Bacteroidota bacterium]